MSESPSNELKSISIARVITELEKISAARRDGALDVDEYEHKFARMIGELRDRRIDGSRQEIMLALGGAAASGKVSQADIDRVIKQLGLA
jgi:hypothetical protein